MNLLSGAKGALTAYNILYDLRDHGFQRTYSGLPGFRETFRNWNGSSNRKHECVCCLSARKML